jgi:hypothetical protein
VSGRALIGTLAAAKAELPRIGLVPVRWDQWAEAHPSTGVLALDTGFGRDYSPATREARDRELAARFPKTVAPDPRLAPDARVIGVAAGGEVRAYVLAEVQAQRIVKDTLGDERIVLLSSGPGHPVRVYRPGPLEVRDIREEDGTVVGADGGDGERWWARENALVSQIDGRTREAAAWVEIRWDAWSGAYPTTSIFGR